jgi:hypothetical protein
MPNFIEVPGPFQKLRTVKLAESESFRPASTDEDLSMAYLKATMEDLEIQASRSVASGFIASAAHPNEQLAIKATEDEAIERISVAAWWALDRPFVSKLSPEKTTALKESLRPTINDLEVTIGNVSTPQTLGHVAVAILQSPSTYPFAVLGSAFRDTPDGAAQSALYESSQSWAASAWLHEQKMSPLLWDVAELRKRAASDPVAPQQNTGSIPLEIASDHYEDTFVAWAYHPNRPISGTSASLAKLAMREGEALRVFTPYNF